MRKAALILSVMLMAALSCNKQERELLEQLQGDLTAMQQEQAPQLPDASGLKPALEGDFVFSFDKDFYGVDAAGSITIHYSLPEAAEVEVLPKGGWSVMLNATGGTEGDIVVTAPDPASYRDIVVTATAASGRSTAAILPILVRNPYSEDNQPKMEAMGYYCFKPWNATVENYQKLADAGLTMVTLETDEGDWKQYIDNAAQAGLKTLAVVGNQGNYWYDNMEDTAIDEVVGYLKDQPSVFGYHMCDEPSVDDIWRLMAVKDKIRRIDPTRPIYINLLANASPNSMGVQTYTEYINIMSDYMDFDFISFDIYPVLVGAIQNEWHMCLATVADAAKRHGIPFWAFAASTWINKETGTTLRREKPTASNIRLQIYTDLAYGAQTVQYFTIQDYSGTDYAPIMRDGTWTQAYEELKAANLRMQKRAFVFKDSKVNCVRQTGPLAPIEKYLSVLDFPECLKSLEVTSGATVSFIENDGNEYIVIVNNYWTANQVVSIELSSPVYLIDKDAQFQELRPGAHDLWLEMGEMLVLKYK
ncbi:MAG: beta-galactosidase [Bacteroidales bacterium]|nr:beta-galactosidase [Bacteroidales bacterium]